MSRNYTATRRGGFIPKSVTSAYNNTKRFFHSMVYGRDYLRPDSQHLMDKVAEEPILKIEIHRKPLDETLTKGLDIISNGTLSDRLKKQNKYDALNHLCLIITLSSGKYVLEKLEYVNFTKLLPTVGESINVPLPSTNLTIPMLLKNAIDKKGATKIFNYSAYKRNCQDFVKDILYSSGISNFDESFVKQDLKPLTTGVAGFIAKPLMDGVTNLQERYDILKNGGDI
jgi:hypothetical protein